MKCPVCNTKCNDNTQICQICAWEFSIWVSEISDEQRNLYNQKLKIAQNNWQKLKHMETKFQALEQNPVKTTHQPKKQQPVKPASANPPDLLLDPFETEDEYRSRIQNYGPIKAGTGKLIKEKYDINTGKFPVEIKKDKWITDNDLFHCYDPYIMAERDIARDIFNKSQEYPIIAHLEVHNRKLFCKTILLDTNQKQFEINNIFEEAIPSKNSFVDPITNMEFLYVPGGWFKMGDTFGDGESNEKPVHDVHLYGFFIGKYPVTQGQWEIVMNNNPSNFKNGKNYPVEMVSWDDTQSFIQKLNNRSKVNIFRLPTEAEWEYAARSGGKNEKYAGGQNIEDVAWYGNNSNSSTQIVGQKSPNDLGLYDMSGNVWEWCEDQNHSYSDQKVHNPIFTDNNAGSRVVRGGAWCCDAGRCRAARRDWFEPGGRDGHIGFRLVSSPRSVI
jgi:formylglycine-generating enzyme required for sulfatase activity